MPCVISRKYPHELVLYAVRLKRQYGLGHKRIAKRLLLEKGTEVPLATVKRWLKAIAIRSLQSS